MKRVRDNNRMNGFAIIESLIAASLLLISTLALGWIAKAVAANNLRLQLVSAISSVEAALTTEMLDEKNYPASVKAQLAQGVSPPSALVLHLSGQNMGHGFGFDIRPGETVSLDKNLAICSGFPSAGCLIQVKLGLGGSPGQYGYAYRIQTGSPDISLNYTGAGSQKSFDAAFAADEFKVSIPTEFYLQSLLLQCPPGSLALRSMDATTGTVDCLSQPKNTCPSGTLPKSIRFNGDSSSAELECGSLSESASCPQAYYLNSVDTRSLDSGSVKSGRCVYAGERRSSGPQLGPGKRITGRVCPAGYRSVSTCRLVNERSSRGSCGGWCTAEARDCASEVVTNSGAAPNRTFTRSVPFTCTSTTVRAIDANVGTYVLLNDVPSIGMVDCYVHKRQQDCGATWDADVVVDVHCEIDASIRPEVRDAF